MIVYRIDLKENSLINGKYLVLGEIGSGSYGNVYKVQSIGNGDVYALKLLRLWEVSGEQRDELVRKFRQEYETAQIESQYLVHSISESYNLMRGNPYFLMEYCPNGDLSKRIGQGIPQIAGYAHDILQGLYAIHSAGIVHRDLKPDNVLFRDNGHAALTDFGVVGDANHKSTEIGWLRPRLRQALGTPLYMAPEMYNRKGGITYLPTVDLWSFGVMMFEVLTRGSFPFGDIESIDELPVYMKRAKNRNRDFFPKLHNVQDNEGWYYIIDKLLEPDQRKRYQSTMEVMHDMRQMIGGHSFRVEERRSRSQSITSLLITQGLDVGRRYYLPELLPYRGRMVEVGRSDTNNIVLKETGDVNYVSRHHFTVERSRDGTYWTIRDGQWNKDERKWIPSTNGTYLNTVAVTSDDGMKVYTGDIITAGEYKLKVE